MEKIKITADSTCDIPEAFLKEYDITTCPLYIVMGDHEVRDHANVAEEIYQYFRETKKTPKTSAVSTPEYKEFFQTHQPQNGSLIHFNISGEISCTHRNAVAAAQELKNVYVIDSRSLSTGMAVSIFRAVEYRNQGMSAAEIVQRVQAEIDKVQCSFIVDDLTYLHRGGRCSGTTKFFANILRIKPQIVMKDGKMESGKKFRGNFNFCVKQYVDSVLEANPDPDLSVLFITHTKMSNPQIIEDIKKQVLARCPFTRVIESIASGTITAHCGENTVGILFGL